MYQSCNSTHKHMIIIIRDSGENGPKFCTLVFAPGQWKGPHKRTPVYLLHAIRHILLTTKFTNNPVSCIRKNVWAKM